MKKSLGDAIVILLIIITIMAFAYIANDIISDCYDAGYTGFKFTLDKFYCTRIVNGTEEIIRLSEVGR